MGAFDAGGTYSGQTQHYVGFSPCSNGTFGSVWLRFRLDPEPRGVPGGCLGGFGDIPPVLTQAKQWWKILRPGEALTVNVPQERLCYDEKSAKSIEFWGHYDPIDVFASGVNVLLNGIVI